MITRGEAGGVPVLPADAVVLSAEDAADLSDRVYETLYAMTGPTAQYYNNVGYSYMLRGNLTAALTNFRKASKLAPDSVVIANNLQILSSTARSRA